MTRPGVCPRCYPVWDGRFDQTPAKAGEERCRNCGAPLTSEPPVKRSIVKRLLAWMRGRR